MMHYGRFVQHSRYTLVGAFTRFVIDVTTFAVAWSFADPWIVD